MDISEVKGKLRKLVEEQLDYGRDITDREVLELIDNCILSFEGIAFYPVEVRRRIKKELFDSLRGLDVLQTFVEDDTVSEIMINGREHLYVERNGTISFVDMKFESDDRLNDVIQKIVAGCNRVVNESSPIVDARLPDGSRVNIVMKPIALNGPIVTIRRFPKHPITMQGLLKMGAITNEAAELLKNLVIAGYNIFISGGTGSGKTTFLNALSDFIPTDQRVITIEDSAELQLLNLENVVRLETRNSNVEGCREISIRDLIKTSLRMRPDGIIVGNVRWAEAVDMRQCMNTGHDGSMSTGHSNSGVDMLARLENMVLCGMDIPLLAIRQQIASAIDIIIHLGRLRDRTRKVMEITELVGIKEGEYVLNPLYVFEEEAGKEKETVCGSLVHKGVLIHETKLKAAGISV